jgi:5-formyltetrahydrofolate cyclo-ligase
VTTGPIPPRRSPSAPPDRSEAEYGTYSSPPCFLHELDPGFPGFAADRDPAGDAPPREGGRLPPHISGELPAEPL